MILVIMVIVIETMVIVGEAVFLTALHFAQLTMSGVLHFNGSVENVNGFNNGYRGRSSTCQNIMNFTLSELGPVPKELTCWYSV